MATAADMDNLAVVTRAYGPLTVTVLATAGAEIQRNPDGRRRRSEYRGRQHRGETSRNDQHHGADQRAAFRWRDGTCHRNRDRRKDGGTGRSESAEHLYPERSGDRHRDRPASSSSPGRPGRAPPTPAVTAGSANSSARRPMPLLLKLWENKTAISCQVKSTFTGEFVGAPKAPGSRRLAMLHMDCRSGQRGPETGRVSRRRSKTPLPMAPTGSLRPS